MILTKAERDAKKNLIGFFWGSILKTIDKFFYSSSDIRNNYINQNLFAIGLYSLVPLNVYIYDDEGNKSKLPFDVFDDENFIFTKSQEDTITNSVSKFILQNELVRDNIYAFLYGLERIGLNENDIFQVFANTFYEILAARIKIHKNSINRTNIRSIHNNLQRIEEDLIFYKTIINFSLIEDSRITEISNQIQFFNDFVSMKLFKLFKSIPK